MLQAGSRKLLGVGKKQRPGPLEIVGKLSPTAAPEFFNPGLAAEAERNLRTLMSIPDDYAVFWLFPARRPADPPQQGGPLDSR
ncbi:hypothetical protein KME82_10355 [Lysobacter capsici]|nr:hypothetical protein [Lysobacter capsici]QWF19101.1 hypothetical protein KME82_10355 [Lysobacter capsici]